MLAHAARRSRPAMALRGRLLALALVSVTVSFTASFAVAPPVFAADEPAQAQPKRPPAPVRVVEAKTIDVPVVLDLVGSTRAAASIPVKTRVDSQIESVGVAEGDRVKAGQVIFTLDARAVRAQAEQARAVLARDQAQLVLVEADLERTKQLVASRTKSERDLESAKTLVAAQKATIAADEAALRNLEVQVTWYEIKSPIDGRVGSLPLKPGSSVRAADSALLATINQLDPIHVAFAVPQASVGRLRQALSAGVLPVEVKLPGSKGPAIEGRVAFLENTLDTTTGTLQVVALLPNADERLLPGEFVEVRVRLRADPNALVVPTAAVQLGQKGSFVWRVAADGTAEMRPVKIDRVVDGRAVVASGLSAGDRVVSDGAMRVAAGSPLEILPAAPDKAGDKPAAEPAK